MIKVYSKPIVLRPPVTYIARRSEKAHEAFVSKNVSNATWQQNSRVHWSPGVSTETGKM